MKFIKCKDHATGKSIFINFSLVIEIIDNGNEGCKILYLVPNMPGDTVCRYVLDTIEEIMKKISI